MRLIIVLTVVACTYAAKLDRTYLPPPGAASSGGSPGSLNTPFGSQGPSSSRVGQSPTLFGANGVERLIVQPQTFKEADQASLEQRGFSPSAQGSFGQNAGLSSSSEFAEQGFGMPQPPERPQAGADRSAEILRFNNENDGETFTYSFETSNGITAEQSGEATNGVQAQGSFSYIGDDGKTYSMTYTADENGYQPRGDHLPTPPPIPDAILRSIEKNAAAAAAGTQEGAYYQEDYDKSGARVYNAPDQQYDTPDQQYRNSTQKSAQPTGTSQKYEVPASSGFDAPMRHNGANDFTLSRPASSSQLNRPQGPAFRQKASGNSQQQDSSGYRYNPAPQPELRGNSNAGFNEQGLFGAQGFRPSIFAGPTGNAVPQKSFAVKPNTPPRNVQASYGAPQKAVPQVSFTSTRPQNGRASAPQNFNNQPAQYTSNNDVKSSRPSQNVQKQPAAAPKTGMPEYQSAPYQYNPPMSRGQQNISSGPSSVTQKFTPQQTSNLNNPRASQNVGQAQGQAFGAPRKTTSFSPEEGYKY